jgi:hypothetical protein
MAVAIEPLKKTDEQRATTEMVHRLVERRARARASGRRSVVLEEVRDRADPSWRAAGADREGTSDIQRMVIGRRLLQGHEL